MATFLSAAGAARGVQELQDAGYRAYSAGVALRDGRRVFAVFLGPYSELAQAEQDLQRASQIPGYAGGRILQADDTLAPLKPPS
jgi:cell division septation protein DedD